MLIRFRKMQGAGNDFVVLDETQGLLGLSLAQYRYLADRHFGVGADQILSVRAAPDAEVDFEYVIHNADGDEVEHCGNGARCFVRFVRDQGLTSVLAQGGGPLSRAGYARAGQAFAARADADGRVTERFELLTLSGWRRTS